MPILVVDDYSTMIRIIRNLLRQLGFQDVDDAPDGSIALSKMHIKRYSLVISDWNMEPMTGYELLKQVRSDPSLSATPFIMVTAESKTENVIAAKQAGVNNYIVKPFNADTLKNKIEAVFLDATDQLCELTTPTAALTAFGAMPASAKIRFSAARLGSCRSPSSSAWMPAVTNRQSIPKSVAPLRSVRIESPIASTRCRAGVRRATRRPARSARS